jgi:hypothetical protein
MVSLVFGDSQLVLLQVVEDEQVDALPFTHLFVATASWR